MAQQIQKPKTHQEQKNTEAEMQSLAEADTERQAEIRERGEEILSDLDDLLDEIDEVLEENAEDFVKAYRQKGGE